MKPLKFSLIVTAVVVLSISLFSSASWGTSYTKGRYTCRNFERAERYYKSNPNNVDLEVAYATCLTLSGNANEGMYLLRNVIEKSGHIFAALFVAEYTESDGRFALPIDVSKIDEAISAYGRVLSFINHDPKYPNTEPIDYRLYEEENQMELRAHYHVPQLYMSKFIEGFEGVQKYSLYTQDSLDRVIKEANTCLALERKPHFKPNYYAYSKEFCQIEKDAAMALQSLEEKRLVLLATESCKRDLPNCTEYNELYGQIDNILRQRASKWIASAKKHNVNLLF